MRSFQDRDRTFGGMPADLGPLLHAVDVGRGRQQLYEDQMPELLQSLAQQTRVESIRASVAIEGVEVDAERAEKLARPSPPRFRNRDEREFAGYADAIDGLMREERLELITPADLLAIHAQLFKHTAVPGGKLKTENNLIGDKDASGRFVRIFTPPTWQETEGLLVSLCGSYQYTVENETAHPLILLAAFVLDLLAIHPVEDGNGRMARLASTHELLRMGYGVARYASIEQRIFESKNRYYAALEESQRDWHDATHNIWPWVRYLLSVLAQSYRDFENWVAVASDTSGMTKQERVRHWIETSAPAEFRKRDVRRALPGVSDGTINLVTSSMKAQGLLDNDGAGAGAKWWKV